MRAAIAGPKVPTGACDACNHCRALGAHRSLRRVQQLQGLRCPQELIQNLSAAEKLVYLNATLHNKKKCICKPPFQHKAFHQTATFIQRLDFHTEHCTKLTQFSLLE